LGWATYVLTLPALEAKVKLVVLTIAAAVAVAASAVLQFFSVATLLLVGDRDSLTVQLNSLLQDRLIHAYDMGLLGSDITQISAHIWEVPSIYRRLLPIKFRRWLRRVCGTQIQKFAWRPTLQRVAAFNPRQLPSTGIRFRKGKGIIGNVLVINDSHVIQIVNFKDPVFRAVLSDSVKWEEQSIAVTRNLEHDEALKLASRYSQAMAVVIQDRRSGEAIGALTLEVTTQSADILRDNQALFHEARDLAIMVGPMLATSGSPKRG
jgi:hypothetical protein